jgi:predicted nucleic acid-binding Zn ribbon protein
VVERIPQHRHCAECGKAIVGTEKYCSDECRKKRETLIKKRKRQLLMLYFGSFIVFVVLIVLWLGGA